MFGEEILPVLGVIPERVMEHKFEMRGFLAHEESHISVEQFQSPLVTLVPRLVDGLDSVEGGMVSPLFNQAFYGVFSPEQVLKVDVIIALAVPWAHPLASLDLPVSEVVLIRPGNSVLLA